MLQTRWSTVPTKLMVCCTDVNLFVKGLKWNFQGCNSVVDHLCRSLWRPFYFCTQDHWCILGNLYSLWSEVVFCTVWGSVILPHTGANCTSDCLAHGRVLSSQLIFLLLEWQHLFLLWLRFNASHRTVCLCLQCLKILSGTSPFMTTNISATFLGIAKGELCFPTCLYLSWCGGLQVGLIHCTFVLWPEWRLYACLLWMTLLFLAHWIKLSDYGT